jgi:hypothetical protein
MNRFALTLGCAALLGLVQARSAADEKAAGVTIDAAKKLVVVDAKVAPRKLEHLKGEQYPIELIASWGHPKGKKAHETVLTTDVNPSDVHKALEQVGLKAGKPAKGGRDEGGRPGPEGRGPGGERVHRGAGRGRRDEAADARQGAHGPEDEEGAAEDDVRVHRLGAHRPGPEQTGRQEVRADLTGSLICLFPVTDEVVLQTGWTMKEEKFLKLDVRPDVLPKEGTPVKLVLEVPQK